MLSVFMISRRPVPALVLALCASFVACQRVPLLAPSGSTITLTSNTTAVPFNATAQITAQVIEPAGTPPQSGTHVSFTTTLGTMEPVDAETDVDGRAVATFKAGTASGTATITAISGGANVGTNGALKIAVGAAAVGRVIVSASPATVPSTGGTTTITANIVDLNGNVLPSAPVTFTTTAGTLSSGFVTTDQNGNAQTTLTTSQQATVTASVGVTGGGGGTTGGGTTGGGTGGTTGGTTTTGQTSGSVTVGVTTAPTLVITPPSTAPSAGLPASFTFAVTAATTNGSAVKNVSVNWGDGSVQNLGAVNGNAVVSHVYVSAGTYTVTGTVTDVLGNQQQVSTAVTVIPVPRPTILISPSATSFIHPATVNFSIQITAPQGIGIQDVTIDFDDGTVQDVGGASGSLPPIQHIYQNANTYTVKVTVTDSTGQKTVGSTVVTIS